MKLILISLLLILTNIALAQTAYNSLFWEISGNGLKKKSYLYGTFHSKDQRIFEFKKGVEKAFKKADTYAMELNMDSINQMEVMQLMVMDSNLTLKDLLTQEDYNLVNQFFKDSIGVSLFMFERLSPIITAQMIATKGLQEEQENALDLYWFKKAKKEGKQLVGLESMEEQIQALKSIPVEQQAKDLVDMVKDYGNEESFDMEEMLHIYMSGNLDSLMLVMKDFYKESPEAEQLFNDAFLYKRNVNMANRVEEYLQKGSVFMAVGATHLPGQKGVIELLRAKGYTVKAL